MHHFNDITKLAAAAAHPLSTSTFDHVLNRLQNLTLPEAGLQKHQLDGEPHFSAYPKPEEPIVIDTFAPRRIAHDRSPASSQSSSDADYSSSSNYSASQPASPTAAAHEAFYATRSRVVRLYNLPPMAEAFLSRVFLPQNAEHRAHIPIPATLWELRDEVGAGRRASSVWAVFRTHEEACAALALSGRAMSVATALESDLEPFHKLHRVLLTTAPTPTLPPLRHLALDLPPPSPSRARMPELTVAPPMGEYTLSSNPPNPKTSFRLGDWICPSPNCAAHNFGRNLACIGCGCPRSAVNAGNAGAHTHNHQHQHQHAINQVGGGASLGQGARAMPSPRFTNNTNGNGVNGVNGVNGNNSASGGVTTYYSSGPTPAAAHNFQARPQETQQNHPHFEQHERMTPHQQQHNQQHQQYNAVFTQTPSSTPTSHTLPTFRPSSSSTSSSPPISIHAPHTQPSAPVKAAAASASSSSAHPLLTPSGRAFAVGGKVQNISSDPLSPCVMYWPDNEPFPEQGQIRPSCMAGIAPPILNTGNRGPISHQPGDWICQKCNYLNWRRRKVCQTCLPYAEGNGDSISAAVQAERIALLTSVLSQTSLNGGSTLDVPASVHGHRASPAHGQRSHSLTPPQSRRPFIDLPSAASGPHASHAQSQLHSQGSLQVPQSGSHLGVGAGPSLHRSVHRSQSHLALGQQYHSAAPAQQSQFQQLHQQQLQHQRQQQQQQQQQQISSYTASSPIYQTSGHRQPSPIFSTGPDVGRMQQQPSQQQHLSVQHAGRAGGLGFNAASNTITNNHYNANGSIPFPQSQVHPPIQAPAPLLPSFLQDMVQSPALSPTSTTTSSAELSSIEEYDEQLLASPPAGAQQGMYGGPRARGDSGSTTSDAVGGGGASPLANIWRLDGEESKSLSAFPLPNHQELVGAQGRVVGRGDVGPKIRA